MARASSDGKVRGLVDFFNGGVKRRARGHEGTRARRSGQRHSWWLFHSSSASCRLDWSLLRALVPSCPRALPIVEYFLRHRAFATIRRLQSIEPIMSERCPACRRCGRAATDRRLRTDRSDPARLNGLLRGKRVTRDALDKVYQNGVCLPMSLIATDITGNTVEETGLGYDIGDEDRICRPVPGSLRPVPWQNKPMAQLLLRWKTARAGMFERQPARGAEARGRSLHGAWSDAGGRGGTGVLSARCRADRRRPPADLDQPGHRRVATPPRRSITWRT